MGISVPYRRTPMAGQSQYRGGRVRKVEPPYRLWQFNSLALWLCLYLIPHTGTFSAPSVGGSSTFDPQHVFQRLGATTGPSQIESMHFNWSSPALIMSLRQAQLFFSLKNDLTVFYIQFPVFNKWNSTHCTMLASFAVPSHCRFNNRLTLLTYNVCLICKCRLVQTKQPSYTIQVLPKQWRASDSPLLYNTTICNISFIELLVDHQQMSGTICWRWPEDAAFQSRLDKLQSAAETQATRRS